MDVKLDEFSKNAQTLVGRIKYTDNSTHGIGINGIRRAFFMPDGKGTKPILLKEVRYNDIQVRDDIDPYATLYYDKEPPNLLAKIFGRKAEGKKVNEGDRVSVAFDPSAVEALNEEVDALQTGAFVSLSVKPHRDYGS